MTTERSQRWRRRLTGVVWCALWAVLLWVVDRPWQGLGGLVHERLRWLESFVLFMGLLVGHTAGTLVRPRALRLRWTHLRVLRLALYPMLGLTAVATAVLQLAGQHEVLLIVVTGQLSYWAGLDAGLAALPMLCREDPGAADDRGGRGSKTASSATCWPESV